MLIRFRVANHRSICDEQELSFIATQLNERKENAVSFEGLGISLLKTIAIYGGNASGKSNILHALQFMRNVVINSQGHWKPKAPINREPFLLDPQKAKEPSFFEVDLLIHEKRYTYGFVLDSEQIIEEWLYAYPQGKRQKWFVRDISQSRKFMFSRLMAGENKTIQALTRNNSLFLSAAAQNNHQLLTPIFEWFSTTLRIVTAEMRELSLTSAALDYRNSEYKEDILKIIKTADLGITGIDVEEEKTHENVTKAFEVLFADNPDMLKLSRQPISKALLRHRLGANDADIVFPFSHESRGTQMLFGLAGDIVSAIASGALLCVDELDSSLHPLMATEIVRMFNDQNSNPENAQLLFNTHDTNILESGLLRRDQIWFTEKDRNGATHLYPLTDYKPRKQENIKRGYLQGRYGGIPFISTTETLFKDLDGKN